MPRFVSMGALLGVVVGCASPPPPQAVVPAAAVLQVRQAAVTHDREAPDEALRDAINALQDRFKCNAISGCAAHAQLVQFGWAARPVVEQSFARAGLQSSWRARAVQIVAELGDPQGEPFLARLSDDRDPEVRAWALVGLGKLGTPRHHGLIALQAGTDTLWLAAPRLAALWAQDQLGQPGAGAAFSAELAALAQQQMAATALVVGVWLCRQPGSPDCGAVLPVIAKHANFQVRRDALQAMLARLRPHFAEALVYLTNDQARSIRSGAEEGLVALSGEVTLTGHAAWQGWCLSGGCAKLAGVKL